MTEEEIKRESEKFSDLCTGSYESATWAERGFIAGVKWTLNHQSHDIEEERNRAAILYGKLISKMYPEGIVNRLSENFRELLDKEFINLNKSS